MSVLLSRDMITVERPNGGPDEHGWALTLAEPVEPEEGEEPPADPTMTEVGEFRGSVQWEVPRTDNSMTSAGAGPYAPSVNRRATAYLPANCGVAAGDVLTVEGMPPLVVSACTIVFDPRSDGDLDCMKCVCVEVVTD